MDTAIPSPRDLRFGSPSFPQWVEEFRPSQWEAAQEAIARFNDGFQVVMLELPTGCLAGDTIVRTNRAGVTAQRKIADVVERFNGGGRRKWDLQIPTFVQRTQDSSIGITLRLVQLINAVASGVKTTYTLTTRSGRSIRATEDHGFALEGGAMVSLKNLRPGDTLLVDAGKGWNKPSQKPWYKVVEGLTKHPRRGAWPYRQPLHRLVVEADMNQLPLTWYIAVLRDQNADVAVLKFLDPADAVHHRDKNPRNNELNNLEVISHYAHYEHHGIEHNWANVANRVGLDIVESIEVYGEEPTYDLTVLGDPHNYVANEFVVENSGKSVAAEIVRRELNTRAIYLASTKQLQEQLQDDLPYAKVLWGRANFETRNYPEQFPLLNASFCDKSEDHVCDICLGEFEGELSCTFCCPDVRDCPYEIAKSEALSAKLAITNYAYWLREANYVGRFGAQKNKQGVVTRKPLIICDEADVLEDELMGFIELNISARRRRQFGIDLPRRKTVQEAWVEWAGEASHRLTAVLNRMPRNSTQLDKIRDRQWLTQTRDQVRELETSLEAGGWVYDEGSGDGIRFRPVRVDTQAQGFLWRHADRFLMMSATICAPEVMAVDLGLEEGTWASLSMPSPFDISLRPIYVVPRANMRTKTKTEEWPKMVEAVSELLDVYEGERVLIPTVSYELTRYLMNGLKKHQSRLVTYLASGQRMDALSRFRKQPGAVFLAPSMDRGVDMADEDCRCIIIVKVPWANIGDKQVTVRRYTRGGQDWLTVKAIRRLVQATGRGVRHSEDWADVFILDSAFVGLFGSYSRWFPKWWREAIDWKRGGRDALKTRGGARRAAELATGQTAGAVREA